MASIDKDKVKSALEQLDPLDDDQWTADGAPKVETVSALLGEKITRQDIVNAVPDFTRDKAGQPLAEQPKDEETSDVQENLNDEEDDDNDAEQTQYEGVPEGFDLAEFQSWLAQQKSDDLEKIAADIREKQGELSVRQNKLNEMVTGLKTAAGLVKMRIKTDFKNSSDTEATRNYIAAQAKARADRMGVRNTILQGLKISELESRSPLDAAMSRKTSRGTQRPARPLIK
jgi:hypothetical protein